MAVGAAVFVASTAFANTPYISEVTDYCPAPGQFVNVLPAVKDGESPAEAATVALRGKASAGTVSLGAFGGYIVFRFDHPVVNVRGEYDFKVYGNTPSSGSAEPGIVSVCIDSNHNGVADDQWYELAGSNYSLGTSLRNYTISYHRPDPVAPAVPDPNAPTVVNMHYIRWTDNDGKEGWVQRNSFHPQSYWPGWRDSDETISFTASRLASNKLDKYGNSSYYVLESLPWGYVDNQPNATDPGFNLDWAVDSDGQPVNLPYVDFIKVHTAVLENNGWLGESSTEICGAEDLHPAAVADLSSATAIAAISLAIVDVSSEEILIRASQESCCALYNAAGQLLRPFISLVAGDNRLKLDGIGKGLYILRTRDRTFKFVLN